MWSIIHAHPLVFERWSYRSTAVDQALSDGLKIRVKVRPGVPRRERVVTSLLNIRTGLELGIYRGGLQEGLAGLLERVYYVKDETDGWVRPPSPQTDTLRDVFRQMVHSCEFRPVHEISVEEFLTRYKGLKLSTYQKASEELSTYGFDRRRHTLVVAFVKDERQARGKAPRLIRPFPVVFNLMFGCYIYPLEKAVYQCIDRLYGCPTVTKGLNASMVAGALRSKWEMFADPVCIITDCSRFDQHCSAESLREAKKFCKVFLRAGGADVDEFDRLWEMTVRTKGVVACDDGVIHYDVCGTLNSGLSSTSLCGVLIVSALLRYICFVAGVEHQLISAGDDTNIILERCDLDRLRPLLKPVALKAGFTLKVDGIVDVFERIDFCQCRPVFDGETWVMVRNPYSSIPKDLLTSKRFDRDVDRLAHMRAVADCGISLAGGIPVIQSFYRMYRRLAGDVPVAVLERNGFYHLSRNMDRGIRVVSDEARLSFYKAFGVDYHTQIVLEGYFDHVTGDSAESGGEIVDRFQFHSDLTSLLFDD